MLAPADQARIKKMIANLEKINNSEVHVYGTAALTSKEPLAALFQGPDGKIHLIIDVYSKTKKDPSNPQSSLSGVLRVPQSVEKDLAGLAAEFRIVGGKTYTKIAFTSLPPQLEGLRNSSLVNRWVSNDAPAMNSSGSSSSTMLRDFIVKEKPFTIRKKIGISVKDGVIVHSFEVDINRSKLEKFLLNSLQILTDPKIKEAMNTSSVKDIAEALSEDQVVLTITDDGRLDALHIKGTGKREGLYDVVLVLHETPDFSVETPAESTPFKDFQDLMKQK